MDMEGQLSYEVVFKQTLGKVKVFEKHISQTFFHPRERLLYKADICSIRCFSLQKFYLLNTHSEEEKRLKSFTPNNFLLLYFKYLNKHLNLIQNTYI